MQVNHGLPQRTETDYNTKGYGKIHTGNIIAWDHLKQGNSGVERSEGCECEVMETEIPLSGTYCKVHKQVDLYSCRVISERLEWPLGRPSQWFGPILKSKVRSRIKWKHIVASHVESIRQPDQ